MDFIPEVDYLEYAGRVIITDKDGDEVSFSISEARDLGRCLIALADQAGE